MFWDGWVFEILSMVTNLPPHLVERDGEKLCSACGAVMPADAKPSLSKAFVEHVRQMHKSVPKPDEKKPSPKAS